MDQHLPCSNIFIKNYGTFSNVFSANSGSVIFNLVYFIVGVYYFITGVYYFNGLYSYIWFAMIRFGVEGYLPIYKGIYGIF